jgi:hypothetical protein
LVIRIWVWRNFGIVTIQDGCFVVTGVIMVLKTHVNVNLTGIGSLSYTAEGL